MGYWSNVWTFTHASSQTSPPMVSSSERNYGSFLPLRLASSRCFARAASSSGRDFPWLCHPWSHFLILNFVLLLLSVAFLTLWLPSLWACLLSQDAWIGWSLSSHSHKVSEGSCWVEEINSSSVSLKFDGCIWNSQSPPSLLIAITWIPHHTSHTWE